MNKRLLALALLVSFTTAEMVSAATLAVTGETQKNVMVTIYNGNLGLVKDVREVRLPVGTHEAQFTDVAAQIDPTSVHLKSLSDPTGLRILEQNYEYDLLSSDKLLEKYVGKTVRLYQSDGTFHEAKLLSTAGPVFEINGQIHLGYSGRMVLPSLPENLVAKPTLVWLLRNQTATAQRVEASYLTGGITWKSDYVMLVNDADTKADLTGWVTIDNHSGAAYDNAKLKLVAGDVHVVQAPTPLQMRDMAMAAEAKAPGGFAERELFEYHLYELERPATVKENQQKQIELLHATGVAVEKHYLAESAFSPYEPQPLMGSNEPEKVSVTIELTNEKSKGLGRALPKGVVRVYKRDTDDTMVFAGEDSIDHTPEGERVKLDVGKAFDVVYERKVLSFNEISRQLVEAEVETKVRNRKDKDVTVTVRERFPGERELISSSLTARKSDAFTLEFDVAVPAKGEKTLTYKVRVRR